MYQFVDEKALQLQSSVAKVVAKQVAFWVKPQVPIRRHRDPSWLEPPEFPVVDADALIIKGVAKHRLRQRAFANR